MKVVIVQSAYLPWLGYFDLISQADRFVFYDDVQYTIRDWRNRNRVRVSNNWIWLSVPIRLYKPYFKYKIYEVQIDYSHNWIKQHLGSIVAAYRKAPYVDYLFPIIENILNKRYTFLVDLNYALIFAICDLLKLEKSKLIFSRDMNIFNDVTKTDKLLYILEKIGRVDEYISGPTAKSYLELEKFVKRGIKVSWHEYNHPYYNQILWRSNIFISYLSIIDLVFNHGAESLDIITHKKKIKTVADIITMTPEEYNLKSDGPIIPLIKSYVIAFFNMLRIIKKPLVNLFE